MPRQGLIAQCSVAVPDVSSEVNMACPSVLAHAFGYLWLFLWENGKKLISHSLSDNDSMGCVSESWLIEERQLHQERALTIFEQISKVAPVDG